MFIFEEYGAFEIYSNGLSVHEEPETINFTIVKGREPFKPHPSHHSTLKTVPLGDNSFLSEWTPFQKEFHVQETKYRPIFQKMSNVL